MIPWLAWSAYALAGIGACVFVYATVVVSEIVIAIAADIYEEISR